ncbi:hypothetical protein [Halobacillus sp. A5]|uniref:hypothetical protein n=1 Tax=Halobacillus sp. A5 TaxID=2880263 RepID=UPI0020A62FAC|nr:hypothetical protein [Halobacillus sp. A5]MCP3026898.1 hypothetical protein [Halobacillus sp. A5]
MLITKRNWKTIIFTDDKGRMTSRVCTDCGKFRTAKHFDTMSNGFSNKRPNCSKCYEKTNRKTKVIRANKYRAKLAGLPSTMTFELREQALKEQGYKCLLTHETEDITTDHFTALSWGTGLGDTYENVIYVSRAINSSKGTRNPFIWIRTQSHDIQKRFYNVLIPMLASRNDMTTKQFEEYVNQTHAEGTI